MNITFNNRETYLTWRKEWKLAYWKLSLDIKEAKYKRKPQNAPNYSEYASKAHYLRLKAFELLLILKDAKAEANRQWLATHRRAA